ncbi:hypothetical protein FF2_040928 [Malus domestica]
MVHFPTRSFSIAVEREVTSEHKRPLGLTKIGILPRASHGGRQSDGGRIVSMTTYQEFVVGKVIKSEEVPKYLFGLMRRCRSGGQLRSKRLRWREVSYGRPKGGEVNL